MIQFLGRIAGQDKVVSVLEKFCEVSNFPHAFLFYGKRGVGKFYTALQFAKEVDQSIITNQTIKAKFDSLEEPFIKYIFPLNDAKTEKAIFLNSDKISKEEIAIQKNYSNVIKNKSINPYYNLDLVSTSSIRISQIRDLKNFISLNYPEVPYRFIIIEHADLMTEEAQNSLLKNLEEPPPGIIFILITSNVEKVFKTVKSRCQLVEFKSLDSKSIQHILSNYFNLQNENISELLEISDGSVYTLIKYLDSDIKTKHAEILNLLRLIMTNKFKEAISYFENEEKDIDSLFLIFSLIKIWFSDCLKVKSGITEIHYKEFENNIRNFINKYPNIDYYKIDEILSEITANMYKNINLTLLYLYAIFEIKQLSK